MNEEGLWFITMRKYKAIQIVIIFTTMYERVAKRIMDAKMHIKNPPPWKSYVMIKTNY